METQNRRMDEFTLKQARPALEVRGRVPQDADSREHKSAFDLYVRSGEASGLRALETKAMSVSSNPDGGYLVPVELETAIGERLEEHLADPRACVGAHHLVLDLQEAVHDRGPGDGVGRRDRPAHPDRRRHAGRAVVSGDGALRHAGGDADAAGGRLASISTNGSPAKSTRCLPSRRASPS